MKKNISEPNQSNCCQSGCSGCPYFFDLDATIPIEFKDFWQIAGDCEEEKEEA